MTSYKQQKIFYLLQTLMKFDFYVKAKFFLSNENIVGKSNKGKKKKKRLQITYSTLASSLISYVVHSCSSIWVSAIVEGGYHQQSRVGDHDENNRVPSA